MWKVVDPVNHTSCNIEAVKVDAKEQVYTPVTWIPFSNSRDASIAVTEAPLELTTVCADSDTFE